SSQNGRFRMEVVDSVEYLHWLSLFFDFCVANRPFILPSTSTESWRARSEWVTDDGRPNEERLIKDFGSLAAPVMIEGDCEPAITRFADYIEYVRGEREGKLRYLKDWHFQESAGCAHYTPPACIAPDWVNREEWTSTVVSPFDGSDYRFVYYGVKGTWTPFHSDVLSSHSWSANICGRKLWYFVPRGEEGRFVENGNLIVDLRERRELFEKAGGFTLYQEAGEIVFVPSNWHHQVHNLEDTISINHNSINASNIRLVTDFLLARREDVRREIEDVRGIFTDEEWNEQERLLLKADARLDVQGLMRLCRLVIDSRMGRGRDCYVCWKHADVEECRMGTCRPLPCKCTSSKCVECERVLEEYELTVAALTVHRIEKQDRLRE
ncbi:jmjd-4, partial [Pristionchus pacificus]